MYTTVLLRALGYSDAADGDFTYADAVDFGTSIGLVDIANCDASNFLRDHGRSDEPDRAEHPGQG